MNHPQGHIEREYSVNPVATEGRTTKKDKHLMKGNEQTKQHRGRDRQTHHPEVLYIPHIRQKDHFTKR